MKSCVLIPLFVFFVAGCEMPAKTTVDQCLRQELFKQCMASLPKGPQSTVANDWDEVVGQCSSVAYLQALRRADFVKPECMID